MLCMYVLGILSYCHCWWLFTYLSIGNAVNEAQSSFSDDPTVDTFAGGPQNTKIFHFTPLVCASPFGNWLLTMAWRGCNAAWRGKCPDYIPVEIPAGQLSSKPVSNPLFHAPSAWWSVGDCPSGATDDAPNDATTNDCSCFRDVVHQIGSMIKIWWFQRFTRAALLKWSGVLANACCL